MVLFSGMKDVLPGFHGHVPEAFVRLFPETKFSRANNWWGAADEFCCLYYIDPSQPLFRDVTYDTFTLFY